MDLGVTQRMEGEIPMSIELYHKILNSKQKVKLIEGQNIKFTIPH